MVATLARLLGDLQLAEDAVSEAFAAARPPGRRPASPTGPGPGSRRRRGGRRSTCCCATARRRAASTAPCRRRRSRASTRRTPFSSRSRSAVTRRWRSRRGWRSPAARRRPVRRRDRGRFLAARGAMAKRLVSARTKIRQSGSRSSARSDGLAERLSSVQAVLYLVFTAGHLASGDGPAVRAELCEEAIWLAGRCTGCSRTTARPPACGADAAPALARGCPARRRRRLVPSPTDRARGTVARSPRPGRCWHDRPGAGRAVSVQAAIAALHAAATSGTTSTGRDRRPLRPARPAGASPVVP